MKKTAATIAMLAIATLGFASANAADPKPKDFQRLVDAAHAKYKGLQDGKNADYIPILTKTPSELFGVVIATVACYQGFQATEGAVGVGSATRRTVVISFLTILVLGYMITRMFYI